MFRIQPRQQPQIHLRRPVKLSTKPQQEEEPQERLNRIQRQENQLFRPSKHTKCPRNQHTNPRQKRRKHQRKTRRPHPRRLSNTRHQRQPHRPSRPPQGRQPYRPHHSKQQHPTRMWYPPSLRRRQVRQHDLRHRLRRNQYTNTNIHGPHQYTKQLRTKRSTKPSSPSTCNKRQSKSTNRTLHRKSNGLHQHQMRNGNHNEMLRRPRLPTRKQKIRTRPIDTIIKQFTPDPDKQLRLNGLTYDLLT